MRSNIGFGGLLGIAFIVLKLCGVIAWPWLWVLCPIWGPFAVAAVIMIGVFLVAGFGALLAALIERLER